MDAGAVIETKKLFRNPWASVLIFPSSARWCRLIHSMRGGGVFVSAEAVQLSDRKGRYLFGRMEKRKRKREMMLRYGGKRTHNAYRVAKVVS